MEVEINAWGVVAATVAAMVVGSIWYSQPVFGKTWMKLAKIDEKKAKKSAPVAMTVMLLMAALTAFVLAHLTYVMGSFFTELSYMEAAITTAVWVWLGFTASAHISNGMFEQRPSRLVMINAANSLVTILAMGLMIGWVGL